MILKMKHITIIVPAYNESESIDHFYHELENVFLLLNTSYTFKVLFVNDGSSDDTLKKIKDLIHKGKSISVLDLSRNHGKELALAAGFDYVKDNIDAIIIMDADLQHPPNIIKDFLHMFEEGYDDVYALRNNRDDEGFTKRVFTNLYYSILTRISKININRDAGDFRLLSKRAFMALKSIRDKERYTKGYYNFIGFKKYALRYDVGKRKYGKSKWRMSDLFSLAANGILSYTTAPLRIATGLGILISMLSFLYMAYIIIHTIFMGETVQGFPTIVTLILLIGGIQLFCIGIVGEYIGKIFNEVKDRPIYIVKEYIDENE